MKIDDTRVANSYLPLKMHRQILAFFARGRTASERTYRISFNANFPFLTTQESTITNSCIFFSGKSATNKLTRGAPKKKLWNNSSARNDPKRLYLVMLIEHWMACIDYDWPLVVSATMACSRSFLDSSGLSICLYVEDNNVICYYKIHVGICRGFFCKWLCKCAMWPL